MAATKRKIGIYTIAGIAAAIIIIGAIFASGIPLPSGSSNQGILMVSIKDAPVELTELWITIDSLYVQSAQDDKWTELTLDAGQPVEFDSINANRYQPSAIPKPNRCGRLLQNTHRRNISDSNIHDQKGESHIDETLKVPPGHIDVITSFSIAGGQATGVLIDMQPDTAAISQSGNFRPIIKASVTPIIPTPTPSPSPSPTPPPT